MVKMPHWPVPYGAKDINLGLKRTFQLLEKVGNPHLKLSNVIHVAGTNGKGSTIAYLKAIFEELGCVCNVYTSPHIYRFNERIVLGGTEITNNQLYSVCEEVRLAAADLQTTFFEGATVAAILAMSKVESDRPIINLIEVGLGGRLDATNVFDNPLASVITTIDYDHIEFLGDTLTKIALEKAHILKKNSYGVVAWQYEESMHAIKKFAKKSDIPLFCCGESWSFQVLENGNFIYEDNRITLELPKPSLFGAHQYVNAATAVALMQTLPQFGANLDILKNGLQKAKWPARMERVIHGKIANLLPKGYELWVDGAHNVGGAKMIALSIKDLEDMPTILINGRTINRDIEGFLECFKGIANEVYAVNVYSEPKCEKAERIALRASEMGFKTHVEDSVSDAVRHIVSSTKIPCRIIVCGSLYLAADILQANKDL